VTAIRERSPRFTPEEYFAWEERQQCRHEYLNGEVYAMTGGTLNHSDLAMNLGTLLKNHLRGSGCKTRIADARVNILRSSDYVYPDVSVTCDERDRITTQFITYPCLIIEVLSPSTAAYDRGKKFTMYRRNPSLRDYVLVDANAMEIDLYRRDDGNKWEILNYQAGDLVEFQSVNLTFAIEQVYEDIVFTPEE